MKFSSLLPSLARTCASSSQGQQLSATVVTSSTQDKSTFITPLSADGSFYFSDVHVIAAYGTAYHLNFSLSAMPNIPVLCLPMLFDSKRGMI